MTEQTCLSDLMERGMKRMDELGLRQVREEVFEFAWDFDKQERGALRGCCAVGAIYLGLGRGLPTDGLMTVEACTVIERVCPKMDMKLGFEIYTLNDRKNQSLPEILAWLKEQGL